jgi:serine/threonine-protein kinase
MKCPRCRQALHEEARFCSHCGFSTATQQTHTNNISQAETLKYIDQPDPLIGRVLDTKYELLERLGEGGMGAVYRARRLHIGDEVAVKVLHSDLLLKTQAIERFRREARSAAMISHPNVVSIHDFSDAQTSGAPAYIVMEFVRGSSLYNLLRREGRLPAERTIALMRDICAGVGVAHRQGVVHRDLKPDNVIVVPASHEADRESAKVVDFGIAKLRDMTVDSGLTQPGALVGTIYYMSPEQCRGEELDARADVYSLGAMIYEMLTGEPPFRANNVVGFISKHLNEAPPPFPPELKVPQPLADACYKALAKNRNERQADALALGRELQSFSSMGQGLPLATVLPIESGAVAQKAKSNWLKWAAGGLAALFLLLLVGGAAAVYLFGTRFAAKQETTTGSERQSETRNQDQVNNQNTSATHDLRGTWIGNYGPLNQPARLIIKNQEGESFEGVLEQGEVAVTFSGTYDAKSQALSIRQLAVVKGGSWSLGQDEGKLSAEGNRMSGTGKDAIGSAFDISYQWSFARQ